jgi:hypothetical protein
VLSTVTRTCLVATLTVMHAASARAQAWCEDTPYENERRADLFHSRAHVLETYGEVSARSTNFFAERYEGVVSALTVRLITPRLSTLVPTAVPLPDAYMGVTVNMLTGLPWENRADGVAGAEWRLSARQVGGTPVAWLTHLRVYAAEYRTRYLRAPASMGGRPHGDTRVGAELYRECNLYPASRARARRFWSEIWADASWRRTNFVVDDFHAWTAAVVPKLGVRLSRTSSASPMLYATGELSITGRAEPWQNRVLVGGGVRVMPFRARTGPSSAVLRGIRLYAEALWLARELEPSIGVSPPRRDLRAGLGFVANRW